MAENETAVASEQEKEEEYVYPVRIEDAGPAAKKVFVEIPRERIDAKLGEQFKELRQQANIPGFRIGHAPQKLVEKRFAHDVREQVRGALISESYQQALEKNSLKVLGEPEFENPDAIKLPDAGPLSYSFQVEVQPEVKLPDLKDMKIKKPKIEITDENVDQAMTNLRSQQGALVPVEDRGVEKDDYLIADVHVKAEGNVIAHQHDAKVVVRPGRVANLQLDDLATQLAGMKPGETRAVKVTAPDTYPNEALRGKELEVEFAVKDIKRMELAEVNESFLTDLGFDNEAALRDALRDQMREKIEDDVQRAMREQVNKYLLEHVNIELPSKLSSQQADRVISRRAVDLMMRGTPKDQVEANIERFRGGAQEEAARELKLYFILQQVATEQNADVDEAELNGRIAIIAAQDGKRPEKVKQEMSKDGTLASLYIQMREQKAIDKLLAGAQIEEVDLDAEKQA